MNDSGEVVNRAQEYARRHGLTLGEQLGYGLHGIVFTVESQAETGAPPVRSAIKVHRREPEYARERDVYRRLSEHGVSTIRGCNVPQLLRAADDLWVIEMTVVARPFVLDFAGAYLDKPPDFSEEVLVDWRAEKQEQFESRWADVQAILRSLEAHGVYLLDINPGNISFGG